jgi:hypothetical protein
MGRRKAVGSTALAQLAHGNIDVKPGAEITFYVKTEYVKGATHLRGSAGVSDGVVIGIVCFAVTLGMSFRARARDTKRGGWQVRLRHEEYQEAEARGYQSWDIGGLLLTYAFAIAVGVTAVGALAAFATSA